MATKKKSTKDIPTQKEVADAQQTIEKAETSKDAPLNEIPDKKVELPEGIKKSDLNIGSTVTINSERYIVLEGGKLKHKITGKEIKY